MEILMRLFDNTVVVFIFFIIASLIILFGMGKENALLTLLGAVVFFALLIGVVNNVERKNSSKCPICAKSYSDEYQYCPKDGTRLEDESY